MVERIVFLGKRTEDSFLIGSGHSELEASRIGNEGALLEGCLAFYCTEALFNAYQAKAPPMQSRQAPGRLGQEYQRSLFAVLFKVV